ncbi:hypothetical protein HON36_06135 [Candidatus Parcubacteria bacterium]|jgi:hypothetical protein|nr:hypothetical protein [Candidatus Parcubacteria bacterium]MBT7228884.1 hypothetical protein [Candidatus Parcubacteria bacterium]
MLKEDKLSAVENIEEPSQDQETELDLDQLADQAAESQENFREYVEATLEDLSDRAAEVDTMQQENNNILTSIVESVGGTEEDLKNGQAELLTVQQEIDEINTSHSEQIKEISSLIDRSSEEELMELRAKTKEDYAKGLVSRHHKGAETIAEHEEAQLNAYEELQQKIDSGAVNPEAFHSDMMLYLNVKEKEIPEAVDTEQILAAISEELQEFIDSPEVSIEESEAKLIERESSIYIKQYQEAYPEATIETIQSLVQDNARKLVYQTSLDKRVFSGSDHGTRHILEGNMNIADSMMDGLGDRVSAKDKIIIRQIIIDHDIGYAAGVAQAKGSFDASKDHPLFSTRYVEDNADYYIDKFGEEGYEMIREGILQHSYVMSEYPSTDQIEDINRDTVRSITSTVDALGVTAEIKCPAFFRSTDVMRVLQKVKLYAEIHNGKIDTIMLDKYKEELRGIAGKEQNPDRRKGYLDAIENQFSPVTVDMTLGQFSGVVKGVEMMEVAGKIIPKIKMEISQAQALLGNLFGDKMSIKAFTKAMEDFGISKEHMAELGIVVRKIRETDSAEEKKVLMAELSFISDKANFDFGDSFSEASTEIEVVMEEITHISIRDEISALERVLANPELDQQQVVEAIAKFNEDILDETDDEDRTNLSTITTSIQASYSNPEQLASSLQDLKSYITKTEKDFLGME